ncbi:MAG: PTS sugar transporter subunit IIA [Gordonia sp. (in: high G+C Gram-positive bacteria)]|uniref:PTS sugar transporter subunit IIA n=1 Tax=Gordonia TaxID=2053 RepID=UPI0032666624
MTGLNELLSPEAISLDVAADDWRQAITAAGDLLVATGVATAEYTAEMIASVDEKGPYIVIAPGFAFAHARPSPAVLRTGMSWVRLAQPVAFGHRSNDPVDLVVALAATDAKAHTAAMAQLAKVIGDPRRRELLDTVLTPAEVMAVLDDQAPPAAEAPAHTPTNLILTVCGNGLGTSLFLKNTLEQVLDRWGWSRFITVEATDTISAKGKAKDADLILTSGEIARTLGDVGIPVTVIENFTSTAELDAALRANYDV